MQRHSAGRVRASFVVVVTLQWFVLSPDRAFTQLLPPAARSDAASAPPVAAAPGQLPAPPAVVPPLSFGASPFVFTLKGTAAGMVFLQDRPFASGNGGGALFGPSNISEDTWMLGGDVRQSRLSFNVKGPPILGGAVPTGTVEIEMFGGNQINSVPGSVAPVTIRDMLGNPVGTGSVQTLTTSAQGDESLLPRMRTAYVELNWDAGQNVLRVGQFHNLLLAMISASVAQPGTLGYAAGQIGWRSPGITYLHRFVLNDDVNLDTGLQVSRNSWTDNVPSCAAGMAPPMANCLPGGVSLGEASLLPQVEARLLFSGGKTESPWPYFAPSVWQFHVVGHWDRKDLSGVGGSAAPPLRDAMDTLIFEAGFKLKLGPVVVLSNGYYGKNTGNVFGNLIQQQAPDKPDVSGFGVWGQLGLSFSRQFSLWGFAGIDRPNESQALAAGFTRLENKKLGSMFAYTEGPISVGLELFRITTKSVVPAGPMAVPGAALQVISPVGYQTSMTIAYTF